QATPVGGVQLGPGARPERPSLRGEPPTVPSTLYRIRRERPARLKQELTPRTNGAFTGSPGGTAAALSDLAGSSPTAVRPPRSSPLRGPAVLETSRGPYAPAPSAAASFACRRAVESPRRRPSFSWAPAGTSPCTT